MSATKDNGRQPIGVFDSGLGGLYILKRLLEFLPDYDYIYLGDNARLPYGDKSTQQIYNFTKEAVEYLFRTGCPLVILACNTASSQALRRLQQEWLPTHWPDRRVLGVIRPLAEHSANILNGRSSKKLGVIGTKATISSGAYRAEIAKLDPTIQVIEQAAPLLVPLIEEGWMGKPETRMILKKYLRGLKSAAIDSLLLGCTHYPLLLKDIRRVAGKQVAIPDPGEIIAASLKKYLDRHPELEIESSANPKRRFLATDANDRFRYLGEKFLGQPLTQLEQIIISD